MLDERDLEMATVAPSGKPKAAVLLFAPWLDTSKVRSGRYRPKFKIWFWIFVLNFFVLMWCGGQPAEGMIPTISLIGTIYWFGYFLVILPVLGLVETPKPIPATIEEDFDRIVAAKYAKSGDAAATPAE